MVRSIIAGLASALFVGLILALILRPTAPAAPPNSVSINYLPYPIPPAPQPLAPKRQDRLAPTPVAPAPAEHVIQSVKKPGKTWKRVIIIDGRKCYQPMGDGPITARYCE